MSKNMEYRKHRIEYLRTTVEYSLFGGEGGTREAHLMFHVDPEAGSYEEQEGENQGNGTRVLPLLPE